jgi:hypothetical protein
MAFLLSLQAQSSLTRNLRSGFRRRGVHEIASFRRRRLITPVRRARLQLFPDLISLNSLVGVGG